MNTDWYIRSIDQLIAYSATNKQTEQTNYLADLAYWQCKMYVMNYSHWVMLSQARQQTHPPMQSFLLTEPAKYVHVPAGQRSQVMALSRDWYCPGGQGWQGTRPDEEKKPAVHISVERKTSHGVADTMILHSLIAGQPAYLIAPWPIPASVGK